VIWKLEKIWNRSNSPILAALLLLFLISGSSSLRAAERPVPSENYISPTFYLAATPGCYQVTPSKSYSVAATSYKRLFKTDCNGKHHLEVFHKGKIMDSTMNSWRFCQELGKSLKFSSRKSGMYNWSNDEFLMVSNYFPDPGPETSRFRDTVICYAAVTVQGNRLIKEVDRPLIAGKL
jgi:hypothetical protein